MSDYSKSKVLNWLRESGYPLELRVARLLATHGWDVHIARSYTDLTTGKAREIDVVATRRHSAKVVDKPYSATIKLIIECKSSDKPWIGFMSEHNSNASYVGFSLPHSLDGTKAFSAAEKHGALLVWPYRPSQRKCHGITQAFGSNENAPSGAWAATMGVMSATRSLGAPQEGLGRSLQRAFSAVEIYQPLIVLSGPLYTLSLDNSGQELLEEANFLDVLLPGEHGLSSDRVPILTENHLQSWVVNATNSVDDALTRLLRNHEEIDSILAIPDPDPLGLASLFANSTQPHDPRGAT